MRQARRLAHQSGTVAIVGVVLHEVAGVTAIHTTWRAESDPNDGDDGALKARLAELLASARPAVVLDLHTSKSRRGYDVDLGTMHGASLIGREDLRDTLEDALRAEGVANLSRDFFPAARQDTVTKFVAAHGVPCIQVEVNGRWTPGREADAEGRERALRLLRALARFARFARDADRPRER